MSQNEDLNTLISKHLQDLKTHPHIQDVTPVKSLVYQVSYWPQDLDSLYSEMVYSLKLTIPETYPQKAPYLTFLDKIYHLNVHPNSGQVFMSILKEDWSPFLNLKAIFCSLDQILQQPDESNAATTNLLDEYQNDINLYVQKVKKTLDQGKDNVETNRKKSETMQEEVEEVIEMNDFSQKKQGEGQQILVEDWPESDNRVNSNRKKSERQEYSFTQSGQLPQSPRSIKRTVQYNSIGSPRQKSSQKVPTLNLSQKQINPSSKSLKNINQQTAMSKYEQVIKQSKIALNQKGEASSFDGLKLNMIRCKELIRIFSDELAEIQQTMEKNQSSKRIKKLFEDRSKKVEDLLVELFSISEKINVKLIETVRKDFNKYS